MNLNLNLKVNSRALDAATNKLQELILGRKFMSIDDRLYINDVLAGDDLVVISNDSQPMGGDLVINLLPGQRLLDLISDLNK